MRSRPNADPTGQTEASARQPLSPAVTHALGRKPGTLSNRSLARGSARCGWPSPAAAGELSLPKGLGSTARQPRGMGTRTRCRRGRQVAGREATTIGAWMAGWERDGPRVRDAATHAESGREEVEDRDPTEESNLVALVKTRGKPPDAGSKFRSHPCGAGHCRLQIDQVAPALLHSLRWAQGTNCRWSRPAMGVSKRHASAGTHGDADLEQQRSPDGTPRGFRGMR